MHRPLNCNHTGRKTIESTLREDSIVMNNRGASFAGSPKNMPLSHVGHQGTFTILYAVSDSLNSDFIVKKKKEFVKGVFGGILSKAAQAAPVVGHPHHIPYLARRDCG